MSMDVNERIIWSADVADEHEVMNYLDSVPQLKLVKIDRLFTDRNGRFILRSLKDYGIDVFYDAKFVEIPSKLEGLAKEAVRHKPWMVNCMAGSVSNGEMSLHEDRDLMDGLKRFADVCLTKGVYPCGVTVLTSKTIGIVNEEFNGRTAIDQVLCYVEMLVQAGFTDVVCSPKEAPAIHECFGQSINSNTPGIRFADSEAGDQARVSTPGGAIASGSTRVIMGRPLTKGDPVKNFARAVVEIEAALAV
jgi:orotidine-5'-phosphate decarboxylase